MKNELLLALLEPKIKFFSLELNQTRIKYMNLGV